LAANETLQRREVHYSGWVQGVGFRYTTRRLAALYAVTGFVRNLPDRRVQLVVEGAPSEVERFLAAVHDEMETHIRDAAERTGPATGEFRSFDIRR
jgi:acylphosphatase